MRLPYREISTGILLGVLMLMLLAVAKESIARFVWDHYGWEQFALSLDPNDPRLAAEIGTAYFSNTAESGKPYDPEKASKFLQYALSIARKDMPSARYQLGRVYFVQGQLYKAEREFSKVLEARTDLSYNYVFNSYYFRGLTLGHLGQFEKGAKHFEYIIENKHFSMNPHTVWALYADIGWLLFQAGDYERALVYSDEGLRDFPNNPWLLSNKGAALLNLDKEKEAQIALKRALEEAQKMTPEVWGESYPGNNPSSYATGLANMVAAIERNYELAVMGKRTEELNPPTLIAQ